MVKYSYELKRQVIQDYLDGLGGYKKLAQKHMWMRIFKPMRFIVRGALMLTQH